MNKWQRELGEHARHDGRVTVPGKVMAELVAHNPRTVWEARHLPGVGKWTACLLADLGLIQRTEAGLPRSHDSHRWQSEYLERRRKMLLSQESERRANVIDTVDALRMRAVALTVIDECSALVKQFFRQAPGVAADFRKLRQKYEGKAP